MIKRVTTIVLILCMTIGLTACSSGTKDVPSDNPGDTGGGGGVTQPENSRLVIGDTTGLTGDWSPYWSNNASDNTVWQLIQGYPTVAQDPDGIYVYDETVVEKAEETENEDESKTITFKLRENLLYNNGDPIKAKDYAATVLLWSSPLVKEAGASDTSYGYYLDGWNDFNNGKTKEFSGVRLLGEYEFALTIAADNLPYFYDKKLVSVTPTNMKFWLGEEADVLDDGDGVYFSESVTYDNCKKNLENARFATDTMVSSGAYQIKSFDGASLSAVLEINPNYEGDYTGQRPQIDSLVFKRVLSETAIDELRTGSVDLLSNMSTGDEINAGLDLVEEGGFLYNKYDRNGYGQLVFHCDFGPTQSEAVRKSIAHLIDRNDFSKAFTGGFGSVVHGEYGLAQWMYQDAKEELEEELDSYAYSLEEAVRLLEEDGWVYDAAGKEYQDGIRYKKLKDGSLMPLVIEWASSDQNPVSEMLVTKLQNNPDVAAAGMKINQTVMTFTELLSYYYRGGYGSGDAKYSVPTYHMFNMATGFTADFDPALRYSDQEEYIEQGYNTNFIVDQELAELAAAIAKTDPKDKEQYLENWVAFQIKWNDALPNLPLYSNEYHDFFTDRLQGYKATDLWGFSSAILYAEMK